MKKSLCNFFLLIFVFAVSSIAFAQNRPPLSKTAIKIRSKVSKLAPQARISVIPVQGEEEFGSFLSSWQEQFTFYDIDRKINVTLRYQDVRKVKDGYGGYNHLRGRHTDHTRAVVVGVVLAGVLLALIIGAAHAS